MKYAFALILGLWIGTAVAVAEAGGVTAVGASILKETVEQLSVSRILNAS